MIEGICDSSTAQPSQGASAGVDFHREGDEAEQGGGGKQDDANQ